MVLIKPFLAIWHILFVRSLEGAKSDNAVALGRLAALRGGVRLHIHAWCVWEWCHCDKVSLWSPLYLSWDSPNPDRARTWECLCMWDLSMRGVLFSYIHTAEPASPKCLMPLKLRGSHAALPATAGPDLAMHEENITESQDQSFWERSSRSSSWCLCYCRSGGARLGLSQHLI